MILSPVGQASDIFVDPSGNDVNPGTKAKPLSSLVGARDAVRKINKDMKEILIFIFAQAYIVCLRRWNLVLMIPAIMVIRRSFAI